MEKLEKFWLSTGLIVGFLCSLLVVNAGYWLFAPRVVEVESKPQALEDPLSFYVARLRAMNYTITEQELSVNNFKEVTFNQFLWILQEANLTECCFNKTPEPPPLFNLSFKPSELFVNKLWVQVDGVYWEVRFP